MATAKRRIEYAVPVTIRNIECVRLKVISHYIIFLHKLLCGSIITVALQFKHGADKRIDAVAERIITDIVATILMTLVCASLLKVVVADDVGTTYHLGVAESCRTQKRGKESSVAVFPGHNLICLKLGNNAG